MEIVDDLNMINKPIRFARSVVEYNVGDKNFFLSFGWLIYGEVVDVVDTNMFSDFNIYRVGNIKYYKYNGLEYTAEELSKMKELADKLQRKYDRLSDEFRKKLNENNNGKN